MPTNKFGTLITNFVKSMKLHVYTFASSPACMQVQLNTWWELCSLRSAYCKKMVQQRSWSFFIHTCTHAWTDAAHTQHARRTHAAHAQHTRSTQAARTQHERIPLAARSQHARNTHTARTQHAHSMHAAHTQAAGKHAACMHQTWTRAVASCDLEGFI